MPSAKRPPSVWRGIDKEGFQSLTLYGKTWRARKEGARNVCSHPRLPCSRLQSPMPISSPASAFVLIGNKIVDSGLSHCPFPSSLSLSIKARPAGQICKWIKPDFHMKGWAPNLALRKRFKEIFDSGPLDSRISGRFSSILKISLLCTR